MQTWIAPIQRECQRVMEDATHSAKGHFNTASIWSIVHLSLGIPATILAFAAGYKAFAEQPEVTAILALLSGSLAAVITFLNPEARSNEHNNAGKGFNRLKNDTRIFCEISSSNMSEADAINELKALSDRRDELNDSSPPIPRFAYKRALQDINSGKAQYSVDKDSK